MRRGKHGQLPLRWERGLRSQGVPEKAEQSCRELLRQLLREVVRREHEREVNKGERKDPQESS